MPEVALISGHRTPAMLFRYTHPRPELIAENLTRAADKVGDERAGLGFLNKCDEWSFCLTAARMVAEQERR